MYIYILVKSQLFVLLECFLLDFETGEQLLATDHDFVPRLQIESALLLQLHRNLVDLLPINLRPVSRLKYNLFLKELATMILTANNAAQ